MPADHLTPEARRENAAALAQALGIHITEASKALELSIVVTADPNDRVAQRICHEVIALLSRTAQSVSTLADSEAAAELVIGAAAPQTGTKAIRVLVDLDQAVIGCHVSSKECSQVPAILCLMIACYASAAALHRALGSRLPFGASDPLILGLYPTRDRSRFNRTADRPWSRLRRRSRSYWQCSPLGSASF